MITNSCQTYNENVTAVLFDVND